MEVEHKARERSRSQEKASVTLMLHKLGAFMPENEIKAEFAQFGDIIQIKHLGNNPQKATFDIVFKNGTLDQLLSYANTQLKPKGCFVTEPTEEQLQMAKNPVMPPKAPYPGPMGVPPGGDPMMPRIPAYYNPGAPRMPGQGGMPASPGMYMGFNHMMGGFRGVPPPPSMRPPPPSAPAHSSPSHFEGSSASNTHQELPKVEEEKIEITPKMMNNLKVLKNPDKMMQLLSLNKEVLQKVVLGIANEHPLSLVVHNIKVRELWIGNLNQETTENDVKRAFSEYGKIENIEMFDKPNLKFVFLKYYKVSQANKAFENIDNLSVAMKLNLRISYADFSKRNNVVGDNQFVDDNYADLTPYVFMAYNSGINLPRTKALHKRMSEFGKVKGILMKPSYDSNFKSFIIIHFDTVDQALKVRKYFYLSDDSRKRRQKLGNKEIDINILTKVTEQRKFEIPQQLAKSMGDSSSQMRMNMIKSRLKDTTINEEIQKIFNVNKPKRTGIIILRQKKLPQKSTMSLSLWKTKPSPKSMTLSGLELCMLAKSSTSSVMPII